MTLLLLTLAIMLGLVILGRRRHKLQPHPVLARSASHEAMLAAFWEWTEDPKILKAALSQGVVTRAGLLAARDDLGNQEHAAVRAVVARFLDNAVVRRQVGRYMYAKYKVPEAKFRREARDMVLGVRQ